MWKFGLVLVLACWTHPAIGDGTTVKTSMVHPLRPVGSEEADDTFHALDSEIAALDAAVPLEPRKHTSELLAMGTEADDAHFADQVDMLGDLALNSPHMLNAKRSSRKILKAREESRQQKSDKDDEEEEKKIQEEAADVEKEDEEENVFKKDDIETKAEELKEEEEQVEEKNPKSESIDIDTNIAQPFAGAEPFGREDTAQELTKGSIHTSNRMVDQMEKAQGVEGKRAVYRALTRLRGGMIGAYDGVAKTQMHNIQEQHLQWDESERRKMLHEQATRLAREEGNVESWAFPSSRRPRRHQKRASLAVAHAVNHKEWMDEDNDLLDHSLAGEGDAQLDTAGELEAEVVAQLDKRELSADHLTAKGFQEGEVDADVAAIEDGAEFKHAGFLHSLRDGSVAAVKEEMKSAMVKAQIEMRSQERKLKQLKEELQHADNTKKHLISSLHSIMAPKIMQSRKHLEKEESLLAKEQRSAAAWKEKAAQLKREALDGIKAKKDSHQAMSDAQAVLTEAHRKERIAQTTFDMSRRSANQEINNFKSAEAKVRGEESRVATVHAAAVHAKQSEKKLIMQGHKEEHKVEEKVSMAREVLQNKMQQVRAKEEKTIDQLRVLQVEQAKWAASQLVADQRVQEERAAAAQAAQRYAERRLEKAQPKVPPRAEDYDWADAGLMQKKAALARIQAWA